LCPNDGETLAVRGDCHRRLNHMEKALADFDKSLQLRKTAVFAWTGRGVTHLELGHTKEALNDLTEAIKLDPKSAQTFCARAMAWQSHPGRKSIFNAFEDYDHSIRLRPDFSFAYHNRALLHLSQNAPDLAVADCDLAIKYSPGYGLAFATRSRAHLQLGHMDQSHKDVERAHRLLGNHGAVLGQMYELDVSESSNPPPSPHDIRKFYYSPHLRRMKLRSRPLVDMPDQTAAVTADIDNKDL